MKVIRRFLSLLLALTTPLLVEAQLSNGLAIDPTSGISVTTFTPFQDIPAFGNHPVEITIRNHSSRVGSWKVHAMMYSEGTQVDFAQEITVQPKTTGSVTLLVPVRNWKLAPDSSTYSWRSASLRISMTGPGIEGGELSGYFQSERSSTGSQLPSIPYTVISDSLIDWNSAKKDTVSLGKSFRGGVTAADRLPTDWRAYSGVSALVLDQIEFARAPTAVRESIDTFVRFGGDLLLVEAQTSGTPYQLSYNEGHGAGRILRVQGSGDLMQFLSDTTREQSFHNTGSVLYSEANTGVLKENPAPGRQMGFVLLVIALYALMVGPVNLYLLAPDPHRYRLYFTTPLIALVTTWLLWISIIVKDGFGGSGGRAAMVHLLPSSQRALILQEQVSSTGILLSESFTTPDSKLSEWYEVPAEFGDRYAGGPPKSGQTGAITGYVQAPSLQPARWNIEGNTYTNGWFETRRRKVHLTRSVQPTRASVEVTSSANGAPKLRSSINSILDRVLYVDRTGRNWTAEQVRPGEAVTLQSLPSHDSSVPSQLRSSIKEHFGPSSWNVLADQFGRPGTFVAIGAGGAEFMTDSHPSIRWRDGMVVFHGDVTLSGEES
jgi:hypothetical protein